MNIVLSVSIALWIYYLGGFFFPLFFFFFFSYTIETHFVRRGKIDTVCCTIPKFCI